MNTATQNETTTTMETKFSAADAIALTLDQPRGWKSYVAKNVVQGFITAGAFMALQAGAKKLKERKENKVLLARKVS